MKVPTKQQVNFAVQFVNFIKRPVEIMGALVLFGTSLYPSIADDLRTRLERLEESPAGHLTDRVRLELEQSVKKSKFIKYSGAMVRVTVKYVQPLYLLKYFVLILLDLNLLAEYRYLDCFILGRLIFGSRANRVFKYFGFIWLFGTYFFRMRQWNSRRPIKMRLYALELIFQDLAAAPPAADNRSQRESQPAKSDLSYESSQLDWQTTCYVSGSTTHSEAYRLQRRRRRQSYRPTWLLLESNSSPIVGTFSSMFVADKVAPDDSKLCASQQEGSVFYVENLRSRHRPPIARPARTFPSFCILICVCSLAFTGSITYPIVIWGITEMAGPIMRTRAGFEVTYPNCVAWIQEHKPTDDFFLSIYNHTQPPSLSEFDVTPFIMPMSEQDEHQNSYHATRFIFDCIDNLIYIDVTFSISMLVTLITWITTDIILNILGIKRRLRSLLRLLRSLHAFEWLTRTSKLHLNQLPFQQAKIRARNEIEDIQLLLMDHIQLVRHANRFASGLSILVVLWLIFICVALNFLAATLGRQAIQVEYYYILGTTLVCTVVYLFCLSMVDSCSKSLYRHVTSAMALDQSGANRRLSWTTILMSFHPDSMFNYKLNIGPDITHFNCLKIYSWILTANFVVQTLVQAMKT